MRAAETPFQERWLQPTAFMDFDQPAVAEFADGCSAGLNSDRERAIALYYAVRDDFRYDPYRIDFTPAGFTASAVLRRGYGFCLPKATLLAAAARAIGIPARLGYGDVRNHLSSQRLLAAMGTDLFVFHGYAQLWIEDRWVKATPAFNRAMCDRFGVKPLEFDGTADSLFHEHDASGRRHMEYVRDRGIHDDVPFALILATWQAHIPGLVAAAADPEAQADIEFAPD